MSEDASLLLVLKRLPEEVARLKAQVDALQAEVIRLNRLMGQQPVLLQPKGPTAL